MKLLLAALVFAPCASAVLFAVMSPWVVTEGPWWPAVVVLGFLACVFALAAVIVVGMLVFDD